MHCASHGWCVVAAHEGTPVALQRATWRSRDVFHDHRLDDVELAGVGVGLWCNRRVV